MITHIFEKIKEILAFLKNFSGISQEKHKPKKKKER
jgi:hypothetical protein